MNKEAATQKQLAVKLLSASGTFSGAKIDKIENIAGDASGRRYTRIHLSNAPIATVILMQLNGAKGPLTHGGENLNQDKTFVELSPFLRKHGINVPEIYYAGGSDNSLLVEDIGDVALYQFAFNKLNDTGEEIKNSFLEDAATTLYKRAVDMLAILQAIPEDPGCSAFQRSMEFEQYHLEALRFIEHYLRPNGFPEKHVALLEDRLIKLCRDVAAHKRTLMYRDFMPWNIHVRRDGELAFIDYQDMLIGSYVYDIVSLIHDRDADFALGKERCISIARYFKTRLKLSDEYYRNYNEILLQRYFRLAGQFCMLTDKTGNPIYRSWVPGCFTRLGRTLAVMDDMKDVLEILAESVPEVQRGAEDPWDISGGA